MKIRTITLLLPTLLTSLLAAQSVSAYEICGNSTDGFVLKCNDGHTNTSAYPPNHNAAMEICGDHGGIAPGYPKPINQLAKAELEKISSCASGNEGDDLILRKRPGRASSAPAQDYNSSRSNTTSRN